MACFPPSTGSVAPVIKDPSLEARKAMALATSSTFPGRPKACVAFDLSKYCGEKSKHCLKRFEAV